MNKPRGLHSDVQASRLYIINKETLSETQAQD